MTNMEDNYIQNNKLIAKFIGAITDEDSESWLILKSELTNINGYPKIHHHVEQLMFHSSWDWLMAVVEKIEDIDDYRVVIQGCECEIWIPLRHSLITTRHTICYGDADSKIEAVYKCVLEFVKWYNENK